jgi:hypothetical protein
LDQVAQVREPTTKRTHLGFCGATK